RRPGRRRHLPVVRGGGGRAGARASPRRRERAAPRVRRRAGVARLAGQPQRGRSGTSCRQVPRGMSEVRPDPVCLRGGVIDIRPPIEDDVPRIRELATFAFNVPTSWLRGENAPPVVLENYLCAYERDRLVATTADIPMLQW